MKKILVVYDTKYGNTMLVAAKIAEGIRKTNLSEVIVSNVRDIVPMAAYQYEAIIIGGPTHFGTITRRINKFIDALGRTGIKGKYVAAFSTYFGQDSGKAVRDIENRIIEKAPGLNIIFPGLSIDVKGMRGPVPTEELRKCLDFGKMVASRSLNVLVEA